MINLSNLLPPIDSLNLSLTPTGKTLEGLFNSNIILEDNNKSKYILRMQKQNPVLDNLEAEYRGVGYATNNTGFNLRTINEQLKFMQRCSDLEISVPHIIYVGKNYIITEFVEGQTLEEYLSNIDDPCILKDHLSIILELHKSNLVMGDRWGPNIIVSPRGKLTNIDFDIELTDEDKMEFEIAQSLYYSMLYPKNKEKAVAIAKEFLACENFSNIYDGNRVADLLKGHVKFFKNSIVKSIEDKIDELLLYLKPQTQSTSIPAHQEKVMIYMFKDKKYRLFLHPEVAKPNYYTDFLAENIIPIPNGRALDIGTGSGIHALLLVDYYNYVHVDGIDINPHAVNIAKQLIASKGLVGKISILEGEFPRNFNQEKEIYDLIIAEPPQIPTPPWISIIYNGSYYTNEGGPDGRQTVDKIINSVTSYLKKGGFFQILHADFIGIEQSINNLKKAGLNPINIIKRKTRPGTLTNSRVGYIESLGYKFQRDSEGLFFHLCIINSKK